MAWKESKETATVTLVPKAAFNVEDDILWLWGMCEIEKLFFLCLSGMSLMWRLKKKKAVLLILNLST